MNTDLPDSKACAINRGSANYSPQAELDPGAFWGGGKEILLEHSHAYLFTCRGTRL